MFKEHNPRINDYAQSNAERFSRTIMMVALSIQQPWSSVGNQIESMLDEGKASRFVWGNKAKTYEWLKANGEDLYQRVMDLETTSERMLALTEIPGMGLVKAGFIMQLVFGEVGCIDLHNIKLYGVEPKRLAWSNSLKTETKIKKIVGYLELCQQLGGSEFLWDEWCYHLASKNPNNFVDGDQVSAVHLSYLTSNDERGAIL